MTITTTEQLEKALNSNFSTIIANKNSIGDTAGGHYMSSWRVTGLPGTGVLATSTPSVPNHLTAGSFNFQQQETPFKSYLASLVLGPAAAGTTVEIHDRLLHHGGLVGNVNTLQTVTGMDMSSFLATSNLDQRKGSADYSDVQWWLEINTEVGGTNSNATVNVTYNDDSTGNLNTFNVGNNDRRIYRFFPLNTFIPSADTGKYIRGINSLQLSVSTGGAGNLGFVATRYRGSVKSTLANETVNSGWTDVGFSEIFNESCLFLVMIATGTSTGAMRLKGTIVHG